MPPTARPIRYVARGDGAEDQLARRTAPERPVGQPGNQAAADDRGERGQAQRHAERVEAEQVGEQRHERPGREAGQAGQHDRVLRSSVDTGCLLRHSVASDLGGRGVRDVGER